LNFGGTIVKTLLFLIYGNQRIYHLELTYSILSAARFLKDTPGGLRIVLAADAHNQRPDLPVEHLLLSPEMVDDWQMGGTYNHAIKIHALHHALVHFDAPVILIDSDTVFRADPARMFDRIGPGKALFHKREGRLGDTLEVADWRDLVAGSGGVVGGFPLTLDSVMFNSGVLGVDPQDVHLMDKIKAVMQDMRAHSRVFTAEQMAASLVLGAQTELSACDDLVDHYWGGPRDYYHYQMGQMFPDVLAGGGITAPDQPLAPLVDDLRGRLDHRLAARIKRIQRRAEPSYGAAYTAYLSALSLGDTDPKLAQVWAITALSILRWGLSEKPPQAVAQDFTQFSPDRIDLQTWMRPDLRDRWRAYWAEANSDSAFSPSQ
jgi:hypothetical protein